MFGAYFLIVVSLVVIRTAISHLERIVSKMM